MLFACPTIDFVTAATPLPADLEQTPQQKAIVDAVQETRVGVFSPANSFRSTRLHTLVTSLTDKAGNLRFPPHRQCDAGEFLLTLIASYATVTVTEWTVPDKDDPTKPNHLKAPTRFGLQCQLVDKSTVICQTPRRHELATRDRTDKFELEITHDSVTSVQTALNKYLAKELIEDFQCTKAGCDGGKFDAYRQYSIDSASPVLVVSLKRFGGGGGATWKVGKHVTPSEELKFPVNGVEVTYRLTGWVEHIGHTVHLGHYVAYTNSMTGWWRSSDKDVRQATQKELAESPPYILCYGRVGARAFPSRSSSASRVVSVSSGSSGRGFVSADGGRSRRWSNNSNISSSRSYYCSREESFAQSPCVAASLVTSLSCACTLAITLDTSRGRSGEQHGR